MVKKHGFDPFSYVQNWRWWELFQKIDMFSPKTSWTGAYIVVHPAIAAPPRSLIELLPFKLSSGWWFGTMEFYHFPFTWEWKIIPSDSWIEVAQRNFKRRRKRPGAGWSNSLALTMQWAALWAQSPRMGQGMSGESSLGWMPFWRWQQRTFWKSRVGQQRRVIESHSKIPPYPHCILGYSLFSSWSSCYMKSSICSLFFATFCQTSRGFCYCYVWFSTGTYRARVAQADFHRLNPHRQNWSHVLQQLLADAWPNWACHGFWGINHPFGYGSIPMKIPFLGGWTSINPSYFDVNYRGTIGFDTLPFGNGLQWFIPPIYLRWWLGNGLWNSFIPIIPSMYGYVLDGDYE